MALTSLSSSGNSTGEWLTPPLCQQLLSVARAAIRAGARGDRLLVQVAEYPQVLRQLRASFVTLHADGQLRGCVGTLDADTPLVEGIVHNAYAAAFEDPRFAHIAEAEVEQLAIHLSILSQPISMIFSSEADVVAQLRPYVDGVVLEEGHFRGTFLPVVWEQVPDAEEFLRKLKQKAGLPPDYWSRTLKILRYTVESIGSD